MSTRWRRRPRATNKRNTLFNRAEEDNGRVPMAASCWAQEDSRPDAAENVANRCSLVLGLVLPRTSKGCTHPRVPVALCDSGWAFCPKAHAVRPASAAFQGKALELLGVRSGHVASAGACGKTCSRRSALVDRGSVSPICNPRSFVEGSGVYDCRSMLGDVPLSAAVVCSTCSFVIKYARLVFNVCGTCGHKS